MNEDAQLTFGESSRVGLPVRWLVAIVVAVFVGGGGVALANARFNAVEKQQSDDGAKLHELDIANQAHTVQNAQVKKDLEYLKASVDALNGKLDRMMERRGLQQAGGVER